MSESKNNTSMDSIISMIIGLTIISLVVSASNFSSVNISLLPLELESILMSLELRELQILSLVFLRAVFTFYGILSSVNDLGEYLKGLVSCFLTLLVGSLISGVIVLLAINLV